MKWEGFLSSHSSTYMIQMDDHRFSWRTSSMSLNLSRRSASTALCGILTGWVQRLSQTNGRDGRSSSAWKKISLAKTTSGYSNTTDSPCGPGAYTKCDMLPFLGGASLDTYWLDFFLATPHAVPYVQMYVNVKCIRKMFIQRCELSIMYSTVVRW